MSIGITVLGATGKMSRCLLKLAADDPRFHIVGASIRENSSWVEDQPLGILLESCPLRAMHGCAVAIDFTHPSATEKHLEAAVALKKPLVLGTTGHAEKALEQIKRASEKIPILFSSNFSLGIALCLDTVARLAKALSGQCQIEITETHHVHKKDSPSGTARALAEATGQKEIPIQAIRSGEVVGEHLVVFSCEHERIELKHQAHAREAFAYGALRGAQFLVDKPAGLYSLKDLFSVE